MTAAHEDYIKENRLKQSMLDMSYSLGISYNKVRNYMIENDLQVPKLQTYKIRAAKTSSRKKKKGSNDSRPWNWDALP
jgi:hypothetical protein